MSTSPCSSRTAACSLRPATGGIGLPLSPYFGVGKLHGNKSQSAIDSYVSDLVSDAQRRIGIGGALVWGSEGSYTGNDWGSEILGGTPSASLIRSYGFDVTSAVGTDLSWF